MDPKEELLGGSGWRARLGLVIPSINTVAEGWYPKVLPEGVTLYTARMFMPAVLSAENVIKMDACEGHSAIQQISSVMPKVIAYGCTVSSIVQGLTYDKELREDIQKKFGVPATTAAHSILLALEKFKIRRIAIVSPYNQEVDQAEHKYFKSAGLEVLGGACLGISSGFQLAAPEPKTLFDLGRRGWDSRADALVITCLNTRSHEVINALEDELGKPVITSTQATLWQMLRLSGIKDPIPGYGRLLNEF